MARGDVAAKKVRRENAGGVDIEQAGRERGNTLERYQASGLYCNFNFMAFFTLNIRLAITISSMITTILLGKYTKETIFYDETITNYDFTKILLGKIHIKINNMPFLET